MLGVSELGGSLTRSRANDTEAARSDPRPAPSDTASSGTPSDTARITRSSRPWLSPVRYVENRYAASVAPSARAAATTAGSRASPGGIAECALAALARRPDKGGSAAPDRLDLACGVVVTPQAQEHGRRVAGLVAQDDRLAHLAGEALALEPWRIQVGRYLDPPNGGREAGGHMRSDQHP